MENNAVLYWKKRDAFAQKKLHRVEAYCHPDNVNSWHLLERLGFKREAHLRRDIWFRKDETGRRFGRIRTFCVRYVVLLWQYSDGGERGGRAGREHGRFGSRHHGSDDFTGNGIICDFSQPKVQAGVDRAFEQKKWLKFTTYWQCVRWFLYWKRYKKRFTGGAL